MKDETITGSKQLGVFGASYLLPVLKAIGYVGEHHNLVEEDSVDIGVDNPAFFAGGEIDTV